MSTRTTDANYLKYSCQSVPKQQQEGKGEEKKKHWNDNCKAFCDHSNAKINGKNGKCYNMGSTNETETHFP